MPLMVCNVPANAELIGRLAAPVAARVNMLLAGEAGDDVLLLIEEIAPAEMG